MIAKFLDGLAFLARYGTQAFIVSIAAGLALPQLATLARPLLSLCIFMFIALMFARADLAIVGQILRHPRRLILVGLWLILAPAGLIALGLALVGRGSLDPGLVLGMSLIAAAPPILSGPAIAALIGSSPPSFSHQPYSPRCSRLSFPRSSPIGWPAPPSRWIRLPWPCGSDS